MNARAVGLLSDITSSVAGPSDLCDEFLGALCDESPLCEEPSVECDDLVSLCPALSGSRYSWQELVARRRKRVVS
jgi:hypothetical protein